MAFTSSLASSVMSPLDHFKSLFVRSIGRLSILSNVRQVSCIVFTGTVRGIYSTHLYRERDQSGQSVVL